MSKVLAPADLAHAAEGWRADGAVVVLASGCFDPPHYGHVQYLEKAAELGNVLVVSVAGDARVREAKGAGRPRLPESHRAGVVAAFAFVDAVIVCDGEDVSGIINALRPHVYVKGAEYRTKKTPPLEAECDALDLYGGRVEFISGSVVCSSTAILAGV